MSKKEKDQEKTAAEAAAETKEVTAETQQEEPKTPEVPEALRPTDVPEDLMEQKEQKARKQKAKYKGISLKDFNSMRWRPARKGDLDMLGNQVPEGELVLCLRKGDTPVQDLSPMPVLYENEVLKDEEGNEIGTRRIAFKKAQIRKSEKGVEIGGERHGQYKQHTVVVAIENTETGEIHGHVGYWNTELTKDDKKFLEDKAAADKAKKEEREAAKAKKEEEKKAEAAKKAAEAAKSEGDQSAKDTAEPAAEEQPTETKKEKANA